MNSLGDIVFVLFNEKLGFSENISSVIVIIAGVITWLVVGFLFNRLLGLVVKRVMKVSSKDPRALTVSKLVISILRWVVWFIIILLILGQFGVDVTPFIASAGVVGIALGFGAQELVKDFIGGFFIILEHSFNVNEVIEVDGFKGRVLGMSLRSTVIENWRGEVKTIGNGSIGSVVNFSRNDSVGIVLFGVSYSTDLAQFNDLMAEFVTEVGDKYPDFTDKPKFQGVVELAASSINMRIIFKTKAMSYFQLERDIRKDLIAFCAAKGIVIPFPQVVVHNA